MDEIRDAIAEATPEMETEDVEQGSGGEGGEGHQEAVTERDIEGKGDARRQAN
jgi:hypothetical protein